MICECDLFFGDSDVLAQPNDKDVNKSGEVADYQVKPIAK